MAMGKEDEQSEGRWVVSGGSYGRVFEHDGMCD